jgi:uncharacterized protein
MPPELAIVLIFMIAMFVQATAGFGSALVSMPLLASFLGARIATPLYAISFVCIAVIITYRYRHELNISNVWRLTLGSLIGVPIGVNIVSTWDEQIILTIYGIFICAYALYALLGFYPPRLKNRNWQWILSPIAGMMSGAFNTSGPVYVIYGDSQRWRPFEFKGNLQIIFFLNAMLATINHFLVGNITEEVLGLFIYAIPGMIIGTALGLVTDKYINPLIFRKMILILLLIMGIATIL